MRAFLFRIQRKAFLHAFSNEPLVLSSCFLISRKRVDREINSVMNEYDLIFETKRDCRFGNLFSYEQFIRQSLQKMYRGRFGRCCRPSVRYWLLTFLNRAHFRFE